MRIQLGQGSGVHVARTMLREEGLGAFYKVSASELGWISIFLCPSGSFGVGLLVFNCLLNSKQKRHVELLDLVFIYYLFIFILMFWLMLDCKMNFFTFVVIYKKMWKEDLE